MCSLCIYTGRKPDARKLPGPNLQLYSDICTQQQIQVAMETWKRIPLYLVAVTYLLLGAAASNEQYQMFLNKHHDNPTTKIENSGYCDILMNYRKLIQSCVPMNIFIHASETQLQDVCGDGGVPYHGTGNRQSRQSYPVTICRLGVVTRTRRCIYYATYSNMRLFLSCDENNLPVLLDEVLTLGS